jgi:hypothetical protein
MSSKEQFKDALKQKTRIIADQAKKITELNMELNKLSKDYLLKQMELEKAQRHLASRKKWWQFWK